MNEILARNAALQLAYDWGMVAARDGLPFSSCRYHKGTDAARHWRLGFAKQYTGA